MIDTKSLEIISKFKEALSSKQPRKENESSIAKDTNFEGSQTLPQYNRGLKLLSQQPSLDSLNSILVEYDGEVYTVLTNESLEKSNRRSKRKWRDFYSSAGQCDGPKAKAKAKADPNREEGEDEEDEEEEDEEEDDEEEDRIHPLKQARIVELLSPINHPSELITHPAISKTYKSQTLSKLAMELIEQIETEQNNLNWFNKLLQISNGEDWFYLLEEHMGLREYDHGLEEKKTVEKSADASDKEVVLKEIDEYADEDEDKADPFFALPRAVKRYEAFQESLEAKNDNSVKEELVNYLQVSIQRQHEYIENLIQLRNGLVRADRLKSDLRKWAKEMHDRKSS
ncbi:uncharacterized protein LODBEIA_P49930 [Lodderomyces beijingensis]|uniref:Transcriptional regulatory protein RXT2 N-terminal domain-containing protein n=1 Tax=Lodderomyces beijingensis TaxID=1775926 RepID=A0ABP0ZRJ1_9ASCO